MGEVYGYGISQKQSYDFGDKKVNYYQNGFKSLINFDFKGDANKPYEELFSNYSDLLHSDLNGKTVMNYLTSHDEQISALLRTNGQQALAIGLPGTPGYLAGPVLVIGAIDEADFTRLFARARAS